MKPRRTLSSNPLAIPEQSEKSGRFQSRQCLVDMFKGSLLNCVSLVLISLLLVGIWSTPAFAEECDESCTPCHGSAETVHGNFSHKATPGSGPVVIFDDNAHDSGGWVGPKPYFDVIVDCTLCHNTELSAIHGQHCETCHPTPYDTLGGTWNKGCQQGGCHSGYHTDSTKAHKPFDETYNNTANDCSLCHDAYWSVPQSKCLNCHAAFVAGDVIPPVTTSNTLTEYIGPGEIKFSITDNGKVGVGRTFYILDGSPIVAAEKGLSITEPGQHQLEFWSVDQSGNTELVHNNITFNVIADTTPPTTVSDAKPSYYQGAVINLTATDASSRGVKTIYYRLGDDPVQTGDKIVIPATSGTFNYTLAFWSEDWAGNIEDENFVSFSVTSGTGTLRLVWGSSDTTGSPCAGDPEAAAKWNIYLVGSNTPMKVGSGSCPGWSGVANIMVPVDPKSYRVIIDWYDSYLEDWGQSTYSNVQITIPGQVVRLGY